MFLDGKSPTGKFTKPVRFVSHEERETTHFVSAAANVTL